MIQKGAGPGILLGCAFLLLFGGWRRAVTSELHQDRCVPVQSFSFAYAMICASIA
jgi:hypothetical protein